MRIHCIQHVPFETPAYLQIWSEKKGHRLNSQLMNNTPEFPKFEDFDFLMIMGGPMGIQDENQYFWLKSEKRFIRNTIQKGKYILGICLGAQILAEILGGQITRNPEKEIGWFPVNKSMDTKHPVLDTLPEKFMAFHWHGDTFSIPKNMISVGHSEACLNQGFLNDHILALQFHLESTKGSIAALIQNCGDELVQGKYIQNADVILNKTREYVQKSNQILERLLENFLVSI